MLENKEKVLVTGAGGFIGHHLVTSLKEQGYWVRGVDVKYPEYTKVDADEFVVEDLRGEWGSWKGVAELVKGVDVVYHLAANMGGMGFIQSNHSEIIYDSTRIDLNILEALRYEKVRKFFYSSSACVYNEQMQEDIFIDALKEEDAYPALPQDAYGWEKLIIEKFSEYIGRDSIIDPRIARFHNIYGPYGTWTGGREKAPAAMCRKVALAKLTGNPVVEIWGDGLQTRSFCFVDDCVEGIQRLMRSDYRYPLNIGSDRLISINDLALLTADIADIDINLVHIEGNQGVRGRNSDNTRIREVLDWEPSISLELGMKRTYDWIEKQVKSALEKGASYIDLKTGDYLRKF